MLKIGNEDVVTITVKTFEYEEVKAFKINQDNDIQKQLAEIYEFIKYCKKCDIEEMGYKLDYIITLETATNSYGDYNIRKHHNNVYSIVNA